MSFDPQNPRGTPQPPIPPPDEPPTPPASPPPAVQPTQPAFIPPQPITPDGPPAARIAAIAVIVLAVVGVALLVGLNLVNSGSPSPSTTSRPSAQRATPAASARKSASPAASSGSTGTPGTSSPPVTPRDSPALAYDAFLLHVPEQIRQTCTQPSSPDPGVVQSATCTTSDGIAVAYAQYATADAMNAAYQDIFTREQIDANSGSCEDHASWPAEGSYGVEDQTAGRRLCADVQAAPTIYWTDNALAILSTASDASGDADALVQFWANEAGPIR